MADWALQYVKAGKIVRTKTTANHQKKSPGVGVLLDQQRMVTNMQRAWNDPSFGRYLPKLQAIFDGVSERIGTGEGADMTAAISKLCAEYPNSEVAALDALLRGNPPTDGQLREVGVERIVRTTVFKGEVNYLAVFAFQDKAKVLSVCDKMDEMGIRTEMVAAFRGKVVGHDWGSGRPMRLGKFGEGRYHGARNSHPPSSEHELIDGTTPHGLTTPFFSSFQLRRLWLEMAASTPSPSRRT